MKITKLPPELKEAIETYVEGITDALKKIEALNDAYTEATTRVEALSNEYGSLRAKGEVTRQIAAELNAIRAEMAMVKEQVAKDEKAILAAVKELQSWFRGACDKISKACLPLREAVEKKFLLAVSPFYSSETSARQAVGFCDALAELDWFLKGRNYPPIGMTDPHAIVALAEQYLGELKTIRDGKDIFNFSGFAPEGKHEATL